MAKHLLHSMSHFEEIFEKLLNRCRPSNIVEVGTEYAGSTLVLAAYAQKHQIMLNVIDPAPRINPNEALAEFSGSYRFLQSKSVDALPGLTGDIFFLDGDHNYWTVLSELTLIYESNPDAWVALHDVGFPCARRDQYYAPEQIPAQHRNAFSHEHGLNLHTGELCFRSGFWGAGEFAIALESNTPRNGVLTAIEDFLSGHAELHYASIPLIFGLGVITPKAHADFVDDILSPYQGPLCEALERNRLELYSEVLSLSSEVVSLMHERRKNPLRRFINKVLNVLGL